MRLWSSSFLRSSRRAAGSFSTGLCVTRDFGVGWVGGVGGGRGVVVGDCEDAGWGGGGEDSDGFLLDR